MLNSFEKSDLGQDLDFDKILSFLKQNEFSGYLVLEYLPQFHSQLLPDGLKFSQKGRILSFRILIKK